MTSVSAQTHAMDNEAIPALPFVMVIEFEHGTLTQQLRERQPKIAEVIQNDRLEKLGDAVTQMKSAKCDFILLDITHMPADRNKNIEWLERKLFEEDMWHGNNLLERVILVRNDTKPINATFAPVLRQKDLMQMAQINTHDIGVCIEKQRMFDHHMSRLPNWLVQLAQFKFC